MTFFLFFIFAGCVTSSDSTLSHYHFKNVSINGHQFKVALADNSQTRQLGLMFVGDLPKNEGMLFIFPQEQTLTFWMKNTPLPLSVAFINSEKEIIDIQDMEPLRVDKTYESKAKAKYALEVNQGWFGQNGIKVGDHVKF